MPSFRTSGLPHELFAPLFTWSDTQLADIGAMRVIAKSNPGYPCRVSLEDAQVGEELLLLTYQHQQGASPYRASGPIYVRRGATRCQLQPGELTGYVTHRLMSVRGYDDKHMLRLAEVCEGKDSAAEIERQFMNKHIAYIHLHNAKPGCFSCRVERV